jgi:hypothetical protein
MTYGENPARAAVISQVTPNAAGDTARVMFSGVDFSALREHRPFGEPARFGHLADILAWFEGSTPGPIGARSVAHTNALRQNYPNPFNPETVIEFTLRGADASRGRVPVTLRVYDVAGRLVRTLVDEERSAGVLHAVSWDGRDHAARRVASGVYFYRLNAGEYPLIP